MKKLFIKVKKVLSLLMDRVLKRVEDKDHHKVREIDKDCRECWRWAWMDKEVIVADKTRTLGEFFQKVYEPGIAICSVCSNSTIKYGSRGIGALRDHVASSRHQKAVKSIHTTAKINDHFAIFSTDVPKEIGSVTNSTASTEDTRKLPALMCDRVSTAEVGFQLLNSCHAACMHVCS